MHIGEKQLDQEESAPQEKMAEQVSSSRTQIRSRKKTLEQLAKKKKRAREDAVEINDEEEKNVVPKAKRQKIM